MNTAIQTPDTITDAKSPTIGAEMRSFVRSLTAYSRRTSAMERAYGDHGPDSYKRSVEQRRAREQMQSRHVSPTKVEAVNAEAVNAEVVNAPSKTRRSRSRRRIRPLRGVVRATCAYEPCSKPFERRNKLHRFCSPRCRRSAARLRDTAARRVAQPADVMEVRAAEFRLEAAAALANLQALVGEQVDR